MSHLEAWIGVLSLLVTIFGGLVGVIGAMILHRLDRLEEKADDVTERTARLEQWQTDHGSHKPPQRSLRTVAGPFPWNPYEQ